MKDRHSHWIVASLATCITAVSLVLLVPVASSGITKDREVGYGQIRFKGHGPEYWYNRAVARYKQVKAGKKKNHQLIRAMRRQQRIIVSQPNTRVAIQVATVVYQEMANLRRQLGLNVSYGDEDDFIRVAECESPGLSPTLRNDTPIYNGEHATGLFQFIPSTWASTPFARFDIYNGWANAMAAAWMWSVGRRGEWACR